VNWKTPEDGLALYLSDLVERVVNLLQASGVELPVVQGTQQEIIAAWAAYLEPLAREAEEGDQPNTPVLLVSVMCFRTISKLLLNLSNPPQNLWGVCLGVALGQADAALASVERGELEILSKTRVVKKGRSNAALLRNKKRSHWHDGTLRHLAAVKKAKPDIAPKELHGLGTQYARRTYDAVVTDAAVEKLLRVKRSLFEYYLANTDFSP
jgi:hypothetical protein